MDYLIAQKRFKGEMLAIETDRLRLSVLRKSETARVTEYLIKNRDFHKQFSQTHPDSYFTVSEQRKYLAFDCDSFLSGSLVPFWITLKGSDDIIGRVSFFNLAYGGMMNCATGYHLDQDHTGKGYSSERLMQLHVQGIQNAQDRGFYPSRERSFVKADRTRRVCKRGQQGILHAYQRAVQRP